VLDLLGRTVRILPAGGGQAGARQVVWDGRNESGSRVPAGIYLVQLRIGDRVRLTRVTKLW
jgi:flagellar hook assembly protein FlgD